MPQPIAAPDAVIFDVDGTLLDSVDLHAMAWVDAFSDYGHRIPFDEVRRQIGKGGDQLMTVFLSARELADHGKPLETHRGDILKQRYVPRIRPFPKVRPCSNVCVQTAGGLIAVGDTPYDAEAAAKAGIRTIGLL